MDSMGGGLGGLEVGGDWGRVVCVGRRGVANDLVRFVDCSLPCADGGFSGLAM